MKDRYFPWCDKIMRRRPTAARSTMIAEASYWSSPRSLSQTCLDTVAGVNALAMAALRASPYLLEEVGLTGGPEEARSKFTPKELAEGSQESQLTRMVISLSLL